MPNNDNKQKLVPDEQLQYLVDFPQFAPATDELASIATELRDRRAFSEWCIRNFADLDRLTNTGLFFVRSPGTAQIVGDGATPFEAWKNAKEAGKL